MDSQLDKLYRKIDIDLRVKQTQIGALLALILVPAGSSLEYFIYPEYLYDFFIIRLACDIILLPIYLVLFKSFARHFIHWLSALWAITPTIAISVMVYLAEGSQSPYYAGLNLMIIVTCQLLPYTLKESISYCLTVLLCYVIACLAHTQTPFDPNIFYNNVYFIILTSIISVTAGYYYNLRRIQDFRLRQELDLRNKELQEMDELKSQFFANVSHELRTPLTLILLPLQQLLHLPDELTEKTSELLKTAENNTLRLLKLVNDLLEVTKLEKDQANLVFEPIEMSNFLAATVDSMQLKAKHKDITLAKQLTSNSLIIEADSYALERICLNLLGNAIKFTPAGGTITGISREENGQAILEISDTGIGVDEKNLPHIFNRFHQVESTSTQQHQGTGLGLTLVKELSEKMHGQASATSQFGKGTIMKVTFPLSQNKYTADQIEVMPTQSDLLETYYRQAEYSLPIEITSSESINKNSPSGNDPLILVVDDEPEMRNYLVSMFDSEYRVIQARDGKEGYNIACEHIPTLILLDMMMPKLTGEEVCKLLKKDTKTKSIKIIFLTAGMNESKKIDALKLGADDYVTKPFNRREVQTRVRNLIQTALLEEDLREHAQTLKQTVTELKETQIQLVQSEKLNALGSLAAGLLHEVNNPLNYALTAIQMAQIDPLVKGSEDLRETLDDIHEGMERIKMIVTDLHSFAHPSEIDKQETFSFAAALDSALRFTAHGHEDLIIKQDLVKNDKVVGSQGHIMQVLINLLTNSFKAIGSLTEQRKGEIFIQNKQENGRLHVIFRDNGPGMTEEIMADIFNPFFTTMDVGQGIGLGLSISYTIIENHGGSLEVRSKEGEWSELSFDLPLES